MAVAPASPSHIIPPDLDDENCLFQTMNSDLDKQIAMDMKAILDYIKTSDDSLPRRLEFFSNMDNTYINKCVGKTASNHILFQHTSQGTISWHECEKCAFKAKERDRLREHVISEHPVGSTGDFVCPRCSFGLKTKLALTRHLRVVHGEKGEELICKNCRFEAENTFALLRHLKQEHGVEVFECQKCPFACEERAVLSQHFSSEHLRLNFSWYKCAQCSYRTSKKINLDRHITQKHTIF